MLTRLANFPQKRKNAAPMQDSVRKRSCLWCNRLAANSEETTLIAGGGTFNLFDFVLLSGCPVYRLGIEALCGKTNTLMSFLLRAVGTIEDLNKETLWCIIK